jgi:F-type H+-transporting ATPase subunit b
MSILATVHVAVLHMLPASGDATFDSKGYTTSNPLFPPLSEFVPGSIASIIVFVLLWKYAWPSIKKSMNDRTAGIQKELDDSAAAKQKAIDDSEAIRTALGDIEAERARLFAEADAQAAALLADGRVRIDAEMAELMARADNDILAAAGRSTDELRNEIARTASTAIDRIVDDTLDDAAQQELIEKFISRVGATTSAGATS